MDELDIEQVLLDTRNANKGTERGRKLLLGSVDELGAGRSILLDKDNRAIAGNKTLEAARAAGISRVLVVDTEGDTLVAVRRTDLTLDDDDDPRGRLLAYADNRVGQVSLEWEPAALGDDDTLLRNGNLSLFIPDELDAMAMLALGPPDMDDLLTRHDPDRHDASDLWPRIVMRVPPEIFTRFKDLVLDTDDPTATLVEVLDAYLPE